MLDALIAGEPSSMTMPSDDAMPAGYPVRRMEIFTGAGHRRAWSAEAKAQIVAESYGDGETVCAVARRHGLAPTQLFTWRREVLKTAVTPAVPLFAPVVLEAAPGAPALARSRPPRRKARHGRDGGIELEINGVTVRVGRGAEAKTIAAIIRALKAER